MDHIPGMEVELTPGSAECAQCSGKLRRLANPMKDHAWSIVYL